MNPRIPGGGKTFVLPLILALIPAASGNSRGAVIPNLKISDLFILVISIYLIFNFNFGTKLSDQIGISIVIFTLIGISTSVININERSEITGGVLIKSLLTFPQYLLTYLIAFWASQKSDLQTTFMKYSIRISAIVSILAIVEFIDLFGLRGILSTYTGNAETINYPSWKTYRASSVFFSWHALSMYLSMNFYFGISLLRRSNPRTLDVVQLIIIAVGIFSTLTFTPALLCFIALLKWKFIRLGHLFYLIIGLITIFGILAVQGKPVLGSRLKDQFLDENGGLQLLPQTISFRLQVWSESIIPVILDNFWSGYGFSDEGTTEFFRYSESMYFYLLLSGGVFLFLSFMFMQFVSYKQLAIDNGQQTSRNSTDSASLLSTLIIWLMIFSLIHPYFADTGPAFAYFILLGLQRGNSIENDQRRYLE